ncbi:hypothetical protein D6C86_03012 [Aureobasidium pullulans]|uniref:Uncharacterized protein n=1 Tax=Aureobasidium pullulans TaxID=5580 RepID=A0A4S9PZ51_AURPU|nr:hypothetical protein D6C94_03518 [Aureobasidium pullulans]THZ45238.1 hypothetical protein D6C87_03007 [Aureobasidium pullulans]THZ63623.1 hypothetical protein D6C86_03012 [Aureobasidium pullulans]THZ90126.1 hypothetical protein D6C88_04280 [Aureobasidium pullulans]CAD0011617.1 unnamed protein product [Aureobasidium pullulans]
MAPSAMQKILKGARKQQQAFGPRAWAAPFPHEKLNDDKSRVTKTIKVSSHPSNLFQKVHSINKKFEQSSSKLQTKTTTAESEVAEQSTTLPAQETPIMSGLEVQHKSALECALGDKANMPPCMAPEQDSVTAIKVTTEPTTNPAVPERTSKRVTKRNTKRNTKRAAEPMAGFKPLPRDSHSPLTNLAPMAPMGHKKNSSAVKTPQHIKSSSSSLTSINGVHLLLAVIPIDHYALWIEDWENFLTLSKDHISAYYSSIQRQFDSAGWQVYADCENKTLADLLKKKVIDEEVFGKKLICRYI